MTIIIPKEEFKRLLREAYKAGVIWVEGAHNYDDGDRDTGEAYATDVVRRFVVEPDCYETYHLLKDHHIAVLLACSAYDAANCGTNTACRHCNHSKACHKEPS